MVGAGAANAYASSDSTVHAIVGVDAVIDAENLTISSSGVADSLAETFAGSGGLVAGAGTRPEVIIRADVRSLVRDGADITLQDGDGDFRMSAGHLALPEAGVRTVSGGLVAGTGADVDYTVDSTVQSRIGDATRGNAGGTVTADTVAITANNAVRKSDTGTNYDGDTGGLFGGASVRSNFDIDLDTQILFDDDSDVTSTGTGTDDFVARSFNTVDIVDKAALFTAGVVSGAGTFLVVDATDIAASVTIGARANVVSAGQMALEANGRYNVYLQSNAETYGLGTLAIGRALIDVTPDNRIDVYGSILAGGDLYVSAGTDKGQVLQDNNLMARVDTFAGSLVPLDDLKTRAVYLVDNVIHVHGGGVVESYANIALYAEDIGLATVDGEATATSWASAVRDAIDSALGGNFKEIGEGEGLANAYASVVNDGLVKTGAKRVKEIVIAYDEQNDRFYEQSGTGDIEFEVVREQVKSSRFNEYELAQENLARYEVVDQNTGDFVNPRLVAYYRALIDTLLQEMLAAGEAVEVTLPNGTTSIAPQTPQVDVIKVKPVTAQAGRVVVNSDQLYGTGTFDVPRDARISIINRTHAFLEIEGATIPDVNGGLNYRGVAIAEAADPIAKISETTNPPVNDDIQDALKTGAVAPPVKQPVNLTLTTATTSAAAGDPTILIQNDFDVEAAVLANRPTTDSTGQPTVFTGVIWPDITIAGDVFNPNGDVTIINNALTVDSNDSTLGSATGNVNIRAEITAKNLTIATGGTVTIEELAYDAAGDPYANWRTGALTGNGDIDRGTLDASRNGFGTIDSFLSQEPTTPSLLARQIYIDSQTVNVNGLIQAGKADYTLNLTASMQQQIDAIRRSGATETQRVYGDNGDFSLFYDPTANGGRGQLIVLDMAPTGGVVDITGTVVNTRNGKIIAYGGHPDIRINNQMTYSVDDAPEIVITRVDATQRGRGSVIIKDKGKGVVNDVPYTTIYRVNDQNRIEVSENGGAYQDKGRLSNIDEAGYVAPNIDYAPREDFRYGWTMMQSSRLEEFYEETKGGWLGIDFLVPDSSIAGNLPEVRTAGELQPDSDYFYIDDLSGNDRKYTYDTVTNLADPNNPPEWRQVAYRSWSTWYGSSYTYRKFTKVTDQSIYHTHSIAADRPIDVEFIGYTEGNVYIDGGNSNIVVTGGIQNAAGNTTIVTNGRVDTVGSATTGAQIGGRTVSITADAGIGTQNSPLRTDVTDDGTGARLDAATVTGAIFLRETSGELRAGNITAGNGRDVNIVSDGSILRAGSGSQLIRGGSITLEAESGDIGAAGSLLRLDTGDDNRDLLRTSAVLGATHVEEISGDLRVFEINALSDVTVKVTAGNLQDANTNEVRDERAIAELQNNVWGSLSLTDTDPDNPGAATAKRDAAVQAEVDRKTREYQNYWGEREKQEMLRANQIAQGAAGVSAADWFKVFREGEAEYDANQLLLLSVDEQAFYEQFYRDQIDPTGKTDAQIDAEVAAAIQTLLISRTVQYKALDAQYKTVNGDVFDASYTATLTDEERDAILGGIYIWTEEELLNSMGSGLLKPVVDTETRIEDANITGAAITLDVSGTIGRTSGEFNIPLGGDLTDEQRIILGAAERDDVYYLTTDLFSATVNFDASANTITRTSGNWDASLLGKVIQVQGNSANATEEGPFYVVQAINGSVLTIGGNGVDLAASEVNVAVTVSGLALDPLGEAAEVEANISGSTITRVSGTDFSGFTVGMKVLLSGDTVNGNDDQSLYELVAVSANQITLDRGLTAETGVEITVDQFVELVSVQVQLREDFDITPSGLVNVTAGGETFLGSESVLRLGTVDVDDNARIRTSEDIINTLGAGGTNVIAQDLVLEAGQNGTIGGLADADRIYLNLTNDGVLTARASGSIYVTERAGPMNISTIYSRSGDVDLVADGSILDDNDNGFVNIEANDITLISTNGTIGTATNALEIEARGDGSAKGKGWVTLDAQGDIKVEEQNGSLNLRHAQSRGGDVWLISAAGSIIDAVDLTNNTDPRSGEADPALAGGARAAADVLAHGSVRLDANAGAIGEFGNEIDIDSRRGVAGSNQDAANGTLTANSVQDSYIIETTGNLFIDQVSANLGTTPKTAYITATLGGIFNGAAVGVSNVTGGRAYLVANQNIGTSSKELFTTIGTIQSISTTGSTYVVNKGDLDVTAFNGGSLGQTAGGGITVTASSPITVNSDVTALSGDITFNASEEADPLDGDGDTITVKSGVTVDAQNGSVVMNAGDHVVVEATALVRASQDIVMNADVGDGDAQGGDIRIYGTLQAGRDIVMNSVSDDVQEIELTGAITAARSYVLTTGSNEDIISISGTITGTTGNVELHSGGNRDFVTITGGLTAGATLLVDLDAGNDVFTARGASLTGADILISGGAGEDKITLEDLTAMVGEAEVQGGADSDLITITRLPNQAAGSSLLLDGGSDADDIVIQGWGSISGTPIDYVIDISDSGAPGSGADTVDILGTAEDDIFLSRQGFVALMHGTEAQVRGEAAGRPVTVERINYDRSVNGRLSVLGFDGDDLFISDDNSTIMTLDGGAGKDTFQFGQVFGVEPIAGNSGIAAGDGISAVLTTRGWLSSGISYATIAQGGDGNDTFIVYANRAELKLEGEADNDDFIVRAFLLDHDPDSGALTEVGGGAGDDNIQYNVNAPVAIDGGSGFDTVVVLGTKGDDAFVVTEDGVFGAGLNISLTENEEAIELDGLEGDDTFFVLSTPANAVTHLIGGLGSDTFDVTGDVTETIFAADTEGRSGVVNHSATSGDADYHQAFVEGIGTSVADENVGVVVISQEAAGDTTAGKTVVEEFNGGTVDIYSVVLAVQPTATVFVTVSAARASTSDREIATATMSATGLSFAQGGSTLTRSAGSWIADGFDEYMSLELSGVGDSNGVYEIVSVTATEIVVRETFATTETNTNSASVIAQRAESVLISADGTTFTDALVLEFDATNWNQAQTVSVRAQDDGAAEGERTVVINHSALSADATFDSATIQNLEVTVYDDDKAGLIIEETGSETQILEGNGGDGISDSWSVRLTRQPTADVIVDLSDDSNSNDLTLSTAQLVFNAANWNQAQSVTVSSGTDGVAEVTERVQVSHDVTSADLNWSATETVKQRVEVVDGDTAGVLVRETNGDTIIIDQPGETDDYLMRLTKAPTDDVVINIFDDGQTRVQASARVSIVTLAQESGVAVTFEKVADGPDRIVRASGSWFDAGFDAGMTLDISGTTNNNGVVFIGSISEDGSTITLAGGLDVTDETTSGDFSVTAGQVTFTAANWNQDVQIVLEADPNFAPTAKSLVTKRFPAQQHTTSKVFGPLLIDGGVTEPREIRKAVMLPTESDPGPIALNITTDETEQNDKVIIRNDGSPVDDIGFMRVVNDIPTGGLPNLSGTGVLVNGLGMGTGTVQFNEGTPTAPILVDYYQGISMRTVEIIDVRLGDGDDTFTIEGTNTASDNTVDLPVTAVHGGGGSDTITVTGGAGPDSLLVIYGDTVYDGSDYSYIGGAPNGSGVVFNAVDFPQDHADVIDASAVDPGAGAAVGLTIYGGIGDDTIRGSQGADHIAGGGGDDQIFGLGGDDHIYGDNGFKVILETRDLQITDQIDADPQYDSADTRVPGLDMIEGGAGDDIIIGDFGEIEQVAGTLRLATTAAVSAVRATNVEEGADDRLFGQAGEDMIIGGFGADLVDAGTESNILFGDNGEVDWFGTDGDVSDIDMARTVSDAVGGADTLIGAGGDDIALGGQGADLIQVGQGDNIVIGDAGIITAATEDAPQTGRSDLTLGHIRTKSAAAGGADTIQSGTGADIILAGTGGDLIESDGTPQTPADKPNIILGDFGKIDWLGLDGTAATLDIVRSLVTDRGGDDTILGGLADDIVIGGFGADEINTGDGSNIVLGDSGQIVRTGSVITIPSFGLALGIVRSISPEIGGIDNITGGDGVDVILGGAEADNIVGAQGNNLVFGDNGRVEFDGNIPNFSTFPHTIVRAVTIADAIGGDDDILTGVGADVILGGAGGDTIVANDGETPTNRDQQNIIMGDAGEIDWSKDGDTSTLDSVRSTSVGTGEADLITVGGADDIVIGGDKGDTISGGDGFNILLGDSGAITAGADPAIREVKSIAFKRGGADLIRSGADTDIVIGGAAGDDIDVGQGRSIVFGDNGRALFGSGPSNFGGFPLAVERVESLGRGAGGADKIRAGLGADVILGGLGSDEIIANAGETPITPDDINIVFGDHGRIDWSRDGDLSTMDRVESIFFWNGGKDRIVTGLSQDIVLGGNRADVIDASAGDNVVFGDNGLITLNGDGTFDAPDAADPSGGEFSILSINFGADDPDSFVTGVAGVEQSVSTKPAPKAGNWLNLTGRKGTYGDSEYEVVQDDAGRIMSGVTVDWRAVNNQNGNDDWLIREHHQENKPGLDQDKAVFESYVKANENQSIVVEIDGLDRHYAEYDVYVYLDAERADNNQSTSNIRRVQIGANGVAYMQDDWYRNFDGQYVRFDGTSGAPDEGNYTAVGGMTDGKLVITIDVPDGQPNRLRPVLSGIQIVGQSYAVDQAVSLAQRSGGGDHIRSSTGNDLIIGGVGNDSIHVAGDPDLGLVDRDVIVGDFAEVTFLLTNSGPHVIDGELGELRFVESRTPGNTANRSYNDVIVTGNGEDAIIGGLGNDRIDSGVRGGLDNVDSLLHGDDINVISINFGSNVGEGYVDGNAGYVVDGDWNNLINDAGNRVGDFTGIAPDASPSNQRQSEYFTTAEGVKVEVGLDLDLANSRSARVHKHGDIDPDTDNTRMMNGYVYSNNQNDPLGVNIDNLDATLGAGAEYDVYVYLDADNGHSRDGRSYRLVSLGGQSGTPNDPDHGTFVGEFVAYDPANPSAPANMIVFRNVTGDGFELRIEDGGHALNGGSQSHAAISGLQIVSGADRAHVVGHGDRDSDRVVGDDGYMRFFDTRVYVLGTDPSVDGGRDRIRGGNDGDVLLGGNGDDILRGEKGDDMLLGDNAEIRLRDGQVIDYNQPWYSVNTPVPYVGGDSHHEGHDSEQRVYAGHGGHQFDRQNAFYFGLGHDPADTVFRTDGAPGIGYWNGHNNWHGHDPFGGHWHINGNLHGLEHETPDAAFNVLGARFLGLTIGGNDKIEGGMGDDLMYGQFGDDTYVMAGQRLGVDVIAEAGAAHLESDRQHGHGHTHDVVPDGFVNDTGDIIDYSRFKFAIDLDLRKNNFQVVNGTMDRGDIASEISLSSFHSIETVIGSRYGDYIYGNDRDNVLLGRAGPDTINGSDGRDFISGGSGADDLDGWWDHQDPNLDKYQIILGGNGNDTIRGSAGNDLIDGGNGSDNIQGRQSKGNSGPVTIVTVNGKQERVYNDGTYGDLIFGGNGNDKIRAYGPYDLLVGEGGANDDIQGNSRTVEVQGRLTKAERDDLILPALSDFAAQFGQANFAYDMTAELNLMGRLSGYESALVQNGRLPVNFPTIGTTPFDGLGTEVFLTDRPIVLPQPLRLSVIDAMSADLIAGVDTSDIRISITPGTQPAGNMIRSYSYDPDTGEFVEDVPSPGPASVPSGIGAELRDEDGALFGYLDGEGTLWLIDGAYNPGPVVGGDDVSDWTFRP